MRTLIVGARGQVGRELVRLAPADAQILAPSREQLELTDPDSIRTLVRSYRPELILNAAAYTSVDKAEKERDLALLVNWQAPAILAEEAAALSAVLVHYSTDYVFNGSKSQPYTEEDRPDPINYYGETKLRGEHGVVLAPAHLIFRISWVYGATGSNFLKTILRLAEEKKVLRIVNDQLGAPTWSRDIAAMTWNVLGKLYARGGLVEHAVRVAGLYHYAAAGETTRYWFAKKVFDLLHMSGTPLEPILSSQYPSTVRRPANSTLSTDKLRREFAVQPPSWETSLAAVLHEITEVSASSGIR